MMIIRLDKIFHIQRSCTGIEGPIIKGEEQVTLH